MKANRGMSRLGGCWMHVICICLSGCVCVCVSAPVGRCGMRCVLADWLALVIYVFGSDSFSMGRNGALRL